MSTRPTGRAAIALATRDGLLGRSDGPDRVGGGNEVVGAREGARVARERVAGAVGEAGHALEHRGEDALLRAEADEHRAVVGDGAVGHVAAEDLAEALLIGARDVRIGRLVLELDAVELPPADHLLLLRE